MVYWSWGFLNRNGKCHCIRESSGLSGLRAGVKRNCSVVVPWRALPCRAVPSSCRCFLLGLLGFLLACLVAWFLDCLLACLLLRANLAMLFLCVMLNLVMNSNAQ